VAVNVTYGTWRGMTAPALVVNITRAGVAVDISNVATTVRLYVGLGQAMGRIVNGAAMTKTGLPGQVTYSFTAPQTQNVGDWYGQCQVTWPGGTVEATDTFGVSIQEIV